VSEAKREPQFGLMRPVFNYRNLIERVKGYRLKDLCCGFGRLSANAALLRAIVVIRVFATLFNPFEKVLSRNAFNQALDLRGEHAVSYFVKRVAPALSCFAYVNQPLDHFKVHI
jgi:hypothetical protein